MSGTSEGGATGHWQEKTRAGIGNGWATSTQELLLCMSPLSHRGKHPWRKTRFSLRLTNADRFPAITTQPAVPEELDYDEVSKKTISTLNRSALLTRSHIK